LSWRERRSRRRRWLGERRRRARSEWRPSERRRKTRSARKGGAVDEASHATTTHYEWQARGGPARRKATTTTRAVTEARDRGWRTRQTRSRRRTISGRIEQ